MTCRCKPGPRPDGVRWVPADKYDELAKARLSDPCALDHYPFEPIATFKDPVAHRAFLKGIGNLPREEKK